ncbi:Voltage dependent potassium channel-like protein, partial [Leptotrombidium deliense]
QIDDFDEPVIQAMVSFMYNDTVSEKQLSEDAYTLLLAADKYDIPKLFKICEQYLSTNIKPENFGAILNLADACCCAKLKEKVVEYIVAIGCSSDFDNLHESISHKPYLYSELFQRFTKRQRVK